MEQEKKAQEINYRVNNYSTTEAKPRWAVDEYDGDVFIDHVNYCYSKMEEAEDKAREFAEEDDCEHRGIVHHESAAKHLNIKAPKLDL